MKNIFNRFKSFFTAPTFEGDEEKTRTAILLYQIIRVVWVLPLLLVTIGVLGHRSEVFPPAIVISIVLSILMVLSRIGRVGLASTFITALIVLVFGYADFQNAGNIQPSTLVTAVAIIMSGLLLGRRAPVVTAILIAVSHAVIVYFQMQGAIEVSSAPAVGFENIVITGIMILMIGSLFQFVISRLQFALDKTRENERDLQVSNRELEELSKSLEQRVTDRTKELEAAEATMAKRAAELQSVAEIFTKASQSTNAEGMLQSVVDMTKSSYNFYHAHIYLLDESQTQLESAAGAGEAGKQMVRGEHAIALNHPHSLVARAARTGQGAISNDVTQEPDFLPNPSLPDTKSEMAIPISVGNAILGVLDLQADHFNRFTDEDIAIQSTLAQQVGASLQNIQHFTESQSQAERESKLNLISQQIQSADSVEAVLQITARELSRALQTKNTRVILRDAELAGNR